MGFRSLTRYTNFPPVLCSICTECVFCFSCKNAPTLANPNPTSCFSLFFLSCLWPQIVGSSLLLGVLCFSLKSYLSGRTKLHLLPPPGSVKDQWSQPGAAQGRGSSPPWTAILVPVGEGFIPENIPKDQVLGDSGSGYEEASGPGKKKQPSTETPVRLHKQVRACMGSPSIQGRGRRAARSQKAWMVTSACAGVFESSQGTLYPANHPSVGWFRPWSPVHLSCQLPSTVLTARLAACRRAK